MRPIPPALALACLLSVAAAPGAARACSVVADYRVPTNLELAREANAIVLGQVVGAAPGGDARDGPGAGAIEVRPIGAIKGLLPGEALILQGMALGEPGDRRPAVAGDPLDFAVPHPDALGGACIRRTFPAGATVLFFLRRADGGWVPAGGPFSRWAEDVSGLDAPWAQLATLYAQAALISADERAAMLDDQLDALRARTDEPAALAMASDVERAMAAPGFPRFAERAPQPAPPPAGADLGELGARIDALALDREE